MPFIQTITSLKRYFGPETVAERLRTMTVIKTTIMDLVFPTRPQHASSVIGIDEITETTGVVPVIRRGSRSYPVDQDPGALQFIDPQPITPSLFAKASELNDLFAAGQRTTVQAWVDSKIDRLRRICRRTTEVLCAQSLTGAIAHKMATEAGGLVDYSINYGSTQTLDDVNITDAKLSDLVGYFEAIHQKLQDAGFGGDIRILAGGTVYGKLLELVIAAKTLPVQFVDYGMVLFGKYKIMPMGETYLLPGAETATSIVDAKKICAVDILAPHALHYCALDDLDAQLAPLPFYAKPVSSEDPSGVKIIGNSKPLPAPVLKAILWQRMLPA